MVYIERLYRHLFQISYSSASPALSTRSVYRNFFRTYPPETSVNPARIEFCKRFGWKKMASIYQTEELFSAVSQTIIVF